jgi:hypothetical protein
MRTVATDLTDDIAAIAAFISARSGEDETAAGDMARGYPPPWSADVSSIRDANGDLVISDEYHWDAIGYAARNDPAQALRDAESARKLVAEVTAIPHFYVDEDTWFSCSQAVSEAGEEPGSGCSNDARAGRPCDCGRDRQVMRMLGAVAGRWENHPEFDGKWKP